MEGKEELFSGSMSSGVSTRGGGENSGGRKDQKMLCGEDGPRLESWKTSRCLPSQ